MNRLCQVAGTIILTLWLTAGLSMAATFTRNDAHATFAPATITVLQPGALTVIDTDKLHTYPIKWKFSGFKDGKKLDGTVAIMLWKNGRQVGMPITTSTSIGTSAMMSDAGSGSYDWSLLAGHPDNGQYQIRIQSNKYNDIIALSAPFAVTSAPAIAKVDSNRSSPQLQQNEGLQQVTPSVPGTLTTDQNHQFEQTPKMVSLKINTPSGDENWQAGTSHEIAFSYTNLTGSVRITARPANGLPVGEGEIPIAGVFTLDGSGKGLYNWTVPGGTPAGEYQIVISSKGISGPKAVSNPFGITPAFKVTAPQEGDILEKPGAFEISFSYAGVSGSATITAHKEGGDPYDKPVGHVVLSNNPGVVHFKWTVPYDFPEGNYRIIVTNDSNPNFKGVSGIFNIQEKTLSFYTIWITAPEDGAKWQAGSTHEIVYHNLNVKGDFTIKARRISDPPYELFIAHVTANQEGEHQYSWTVPADAPLGDYEIMISSSETAGFSPTFSITLQSN